MPITLNKGMVETCSTVNLASSRSNRRDVKKYTICHPFPVENRFNLGVRDDLYINDALVV